MVEVRKRTRGARLLLVAVLILLTALGGSPPRGWTAEATAAIRIAIPVEPELLDPANDTLLSSQSVMSNIFDTLVDYDGRGGFRPALAESWRFLDPLNLELKLRRGVRFHNGRPLTADDVVFTFERMLDEQNPVRTRSFIVGLISSVRSTDSRTVVITMPKPSPIILARLYTIFIVPRRELVSVGSAAFGNQPIGTGAFRFVRWDRGQELVLAANPGYWRGKPRVDRLIFRGIPEQFSRVAALRTGAVDIISDVPPERLQEIRSAADLRTASAPSLTIFMGMNTFNPPLNDKRVRQALNYAVDVPNIVATVLGGQARQNASVCNSNSFGYDRTIRPYEHNPARARELLAQAGYARGLTLTVDGPIVRYVKGKEVVEAVAGQLAQVSVNVDIRLTEFAEFFRRWLRKEVPGLYLLGFGSAGDVPDCDSMMGGHFHSPRRGLYYNSPGLDALIERESSSVNPDVRKTTFREIQLMMKDEAPWIFLYDQIVNYGINKRIRWLPRFDERLWMYDAAVVP
jgi:peptide/nickel transport system substrate-binding protein